MLFSLIGFLAVPVAAQTRKSHPPKKSSPPPQTTVILRDPVQDAATAAARRRAEKLRLEAGADVPSTEFLDADAARSDRERFILRTTQSAEGGFDAVNLYDRGILSWGIMQWAAHENSLQETLWYIKSRLIQKNKSRVWVDLFKSQGLDVQASGPDGGDPAFCVRVGPDAWRPVTGIENLRVLFRGTRKTGKYDPAVMTRWAKVFARAGRVDVVQTLQLEWATRRLRACLNQRIDGDLRASDFTRGDLFSDALLFSLWTNNPAASREHFRRAVRLARLVTAEGDPAKWPRDLFPFLWEQTAGASKFGEWPRRTASLAKQVPVGQPGRDRAKMELASRGWRLDALRAGRTGVRGTPWVVTPPAQKDAVPAVWKKTR